MRTLATVVLLLMGCGSMQTQVQTAAAPAAECPPPPGPPPPPSVRTAGAFFEVNDIGGWADEQTEPDQLPPLSEVGEHLRTILEAMTVAERAAAELRAYDVAEIARMNVEELTIRLIELGLEVTPEQRQVLAMIDDGEVYQPLEDPFAEIENVLQDISALALDLHDIAIQVAEVEAMIATDLEARTRARCLRARLEAYTDLQDITRMLEEDLVSMRIEAQQGEDASELAELERLLPAASSFMSGCRRGDRQAVEAAGHVFTLPGGEDGDLADLQEIGRGIIESCRAVPTTDAR